MIKKGLIISFLLFSCVSLAQEGRESLNVSYGANLFNDISNYRLQFEYEKVRKKHNSHGVGVNYYKQASDQEYLVFYNFKNNLFKSKNTMCFLGIDLNAGHNSNDLIFGPGIGLYFEKSLNPRIVFFGCQNTKILFSANNLFRHETNFGIKINL